MQDIFSPVNVAQIGRIYVTGSSSLLKGPVIKISGKLEELAMHPLTDKGLKAFLDDWEKSGQTIM